MTKHFNLSIWGILLHDILHAQGPPSLGTECFGILESAREGLLGKRGRKQEAAD